MNDIHLAEQGGRVLNVWERHGYVLTRTAMGVTGIVVRVGIRGRTALPLQELVSELASFGPKKRSNQKAAPSLRVGLGLGSNRLD